MGAIDTFTPNKYSQFSADVVNYIAKKVLELAYRDLVFYQFGSKLKFETERGLTYTATMYNRLPLPQSALNEGIPSTGETMSISQISGVAQQWGDLVNITDVAELTIFHPVFKLAEELVALQVAETLERNTVNTLLTGTNVYFAGGGSSRSSVGTNVLNTATLSTVLAKLRKYGARPFGMGVARGADGGKDVDVPFDAGRLRNPTAASSHYVGVVTPSVEQDLLNNTTITAAFQYSAIQALYAGEVGVWGGVRWCRSNLMPEFTSGTGPTLTAATTGGTLASGTYYVVVTGVDTQNWFESVIYTETNVAVTGPTGSITLTTPNVPGFVYNVYVGTATGAEKLNQSNIAYNTAVTITAASSGSAAPVPPGLASATSVVHPIFIFGQAAFGIAPLDRLRIFYLKEADKSDPQNQLRIVSWKIFYATIIENNQFMYRIEASTAYPA